MPRHVWLRLALLCLAPGLRSAEYFDLILRFNPHTQRKFIETLVITSRTGMEQVTLVGEGVSPSLAMEPEDGLVDMGHIVAGESASKTVTLRNTSVFPLTYFIKSVGREYFNYDGSEVFSCSPSEATVDAGQTQEVTVTFAPDFARKAPSVAVFLVDIPNQDEEMRLTVRGRCWDRQLYVMPAAVGDELPDDDPAKAEWTLETPAALGRTAADELAATVSAATEAAERAAVALAGTDGAAAGAGAALGSEDPLLRTPYELRLTFPKPSRGGEEEVSMEKEIVIGSCNAQVGSAAGTYELVLPDDPATKGVFEVEPAKGTVAPGSTTTVKCTFKPPTDKPRSVGTSDNVGQWLQADVRCLLKGGSLGKGVPDDQEAHIMLRGFVPI